MRPFCISTLCGLNQSIKNIFSILQNLRQNQYQAILQQLLSQVTIQMAMVTHMVDGSRRRLLRINNPTEIYMFTISTYQVLYFCKNLNLSKTIKNLLDRFRFRPLNFSIHRLTCSQFLFLILHG